MADHDSILIYNPTAGRRQQFRLLDSLLPILRRGGWPVEAVPTAAAGDATRLAREAAAGGAEAIFALGGDGTVREAAAGLLGGPTPLAILPGGTTNVLAHALGLPADPRAAARAYAAARVHGGERSNGDGTPPVRHLDVGLCGDRPFLMMASGGFDAFVLEQLDPGLKARLGKLGIALQGILELPRYRHPRIELVVDGETMQVGFFAVCNIPFYAGTLELCPAARCDDGQLDLITFHGGGPTETVSFGVALARGTHLDHPDVAVRRVTEVEVRAPAHAPVQIDGDPARAEVPVTIRLAPHSLPVLAPAAA